MNMALAPRDEFFPQHRARSAKSAFLLGSGGDERIAVDPLTGRNR